MNKTTGIMIVIAVLGVLFLGTGITGHVISQSCCFGENCAPEYRCFEPEIEEPMQMSDDASLLFGGVLIAISLVGLVSHKLKWNNY